MTKTISISFDILARMEALRCFCARINNAMEGHRRFFSFYMRYVRACFFQREWRDSASLLSCMSRGGYVRARVFARLRFSFYIKKIYWRPQPQKKNHMVHFAFKNGGHGTDAVFRVKWCLRGGGMPPSFFKNSVRQTP